MTKPIDVSVIIPTFRRPELLPSVIAAIVDEYPRAIEVIVVHRASEDPETAKWLASAQGTYSTVVPVTIDVTGKVAALNLALKLAKGEVIAMLDDDIVVKPGWLKKILFHFEDASVGAVGGRDIVHTESGPSRLKRQARAGYRSWYGRYIGNHDIVSGPARQVEVLKGCNWAVRRSAIGALRFDERLLGIGAQAGDDYWFCINLRLAGWRIILDPSAEVDHYPAYKPDYAQGTFGQKKCFEWTANQTAHNLAFATPLQKTIYLLYHLVVGLRHCPGCYYIIHSLVKRPRSVVGQVLGGWRGFIKGWRMAEEFRRLPPGKANPPPEPSNPTLFGVFRGSELR